MKLWKSNHCTIYQVLNGRSNSFLISNQSNSILVDTGRKNSWETLTLQIDKFLGKNNLSNLILTHTHFDHAENASKIKEKYDSKIILHGIEAEHLKMGNAPLPKGNNGVTRFLIDVIGKKMESHYSYEPVDPDILIDENYSLNNLGFNVDIIHTPGHSNGSISVIIDNSIALVGDTLFGVFGNSVYPPFADDTKILIKSWKKLLNTHCSLFIPGHGKEINRKLLESQYYKYSKD